MNMPHPMRLSRQVVLWVLSHKVLLPFKTQSAVTCEGLFSIMHPACGIHALLRSRLPLPFWHSREVFVWWIFFLLFFQFWSSLLFCFHVLFCFNSDFGYFIIIIIFGYIIITNELFVLIVVNHLELSHWIRRAEYKYFKRNTSRLIWTHFTEFCTANTKDRNYRSILVFRVTLSRTFPSMFTAIE